MVHHQRYVTNSILRCSTIIFIFSINATRVRVGTVYLWKPVSTHYFVNWIRHPEFNPETLENDLGIYVLQTPIGFSDITRPIALQTGTGVSAGALGAVAGFREGNELHYLETRVVDAESCKQNRVVTRNHICGYAVAYQRPFWNCIGEVGAPLTINYRLAGIVSVAAGCDEGKLDVFTNVTAYTQWIQENTQYTELRK